MLARALLIASLALPACGSRDGGDGVESLPPPCDAAQTMAIRTSFAGTRSQAGAMAGVDLRTVQESRRSS